jgi:flagellar basal-body rod modification protein FlgD
MITSINTSTQTPASPAARAADKQTLGQADFIRLMTTQMRMQDPLEPVDNKEMIAQMAQFSSLSGIENINSTLKSISAQLDRVMSAQNTTQTPA